MKQNQLSELTQNCNPAKLAELAEKFKAFELAELGDRMQEEQVNEVYDQVLRDGEFYAERDGGRAGVAKGGRVLSHRDDYLLSEADFKTLTDRAGAILVERGICDKDGRYIVPFTTMKVDARRALIDFIIREIIPASFRSAFWENRLNYTQMNKLLDITRPLVANA